jgi:DNA topoisomerase I
VINDFEEYKVLNGRYGPYITFGKENFKIPRGQEPAGLTLEDCIKIVEGADKTKTKTKTKTKPKAKKKK